MGVSFNIVILPNEEIRKKAIELSQLVAKDHETEFVLNEPNLFPHMTVYQAHFPKENTNKLKEAITSVASQTKSFFIELDKISTNYRTFLFWHAVKTQQLQNLHQQIIDSANPLRNGLILPILENITTENDQDKNDIASYGSLLVMNRYTPHITITRLKNATEGKKAIRLLGTQTARFEVKSLTLGYLGEHGTVTEIIDEFPLAK